MFSLIGLLNTAIHYAVFVTLFRLAGTPLLIASAIGYSCAVINSYLMNRRWTFRAQHSRSLREFAGFGLVNLVALGVNLLGLRFLVSVGVVAELAQLFAIGGSLVVNFAGNRLWVFADRH